MITSKILNRYKNIRHGFFNKTGGVSKGIYKSLNCGPGSLDKKKNIYKNINIVSKKLGFQKNKLILLNQIHSNKIFYVNRIKKKKIEGDGIITSKDGLALGILTADCAPILFHDPKNTLIGAVHAGWKGAYKKIIGRMIKFLIKKGTNLNHLNVIIGPCISKNSYEVKIDFKKKFIRENPKNKIHFVHKRNKIFFSLKDYIKSQLIILGVKNIEIINKDTYHEKNNFFSARRALKKNYEDYGRNISVIMIK